MNRITSRIDTGSSEFAINREAYLSDLDTLRERQQWAIDGGERRQRSIDRHHDRGKIMVRDRIDLVTDNNTPFLEFSTLSAFGQYDDEAPGAGIVTGIGVIHGVPWVFIANDATVKGGSLLPVSIKKHVRAQEIAEENRLGVIYLVDSGGACKAFPNCPSYSAGAPPEAPMCQRSATKSSWSKASAGSSWAAHQSSRPP